MTEARHRRPLPALVLLVVAAGYVALRLSMNREYEFATWAKLIAFDAPLPFGHRVLVPLLAKPLVALGAPIPVAFAGLEFLAALALLVSLRRAIGVRTGRRPGWLFAFGFLFVLPYAYLLQHKWPIFYPWDTPAMVAVAIGLNAVQRRRYHLALVVTILAALNRESAVVLPLIMLAIGVSDPERRRATLAWAGLMAVAFIATRQAIAIALPDAAGPSLHFTVEGNYRLFANLAWLTDSGHILLFVASLGFLPLLWIPMWFHIPTDLRRLHLPALAVMAALLVVGNAYEPRAFGEVLVLLYVPLAVGLTAWLHGRKPPPSTSNPLWLRSIDALGALAITAAFAVFAFALSRYAFLPVAQWPMP